MADTGIQLLRTSGTSAPSASQLAEGELALSINSDNPKIFFKKKDDTIAELDANWGDRIKAIEDTLADAINFEAQTY